MHLQQIKSLLSAVAMSCFITYMISILVTVRRRWRMSREQGCARSRTLSWSEYFSSWELTRYAEVHNHEYLEGATRRYAEFGNTFQTTMFGAILFNTMDPENVKAVLSTNFHDYSIGTRRISAFRPLLGDGIFNTDGALAAHSRMQIRPTFAKDYISNMSSYEKHVTNLQHLIPTDGQEVDLQPLFFQITMDLSTESLFGKSSSLLLMSQEESSSPAAKFAESFGTTQTEAGLRLCLGNLAVLLPSHKFKKDLQYLEAYIDRLMEESANEELGSGAQQALSGRIDEPVMLRNQLMSVLLAGRDTTASLMSNLWFILARRPDIWAKLQDEVSQLNGENPTYQQLNAMKYLRHCINESLRLNPPVPMNNREAIRDTVLPRGGGLDGSSPILVPAGSIVGWHCYSMHRRDDIFGEDADTFRPERWINLRPGWAYVPFNGGPRICLGQQLAITTASYVTVSLMQAFESIEPRDPEPWREELTLTCASHNGVKVSLMPRST